MIQPERKDRAFILELLQGGRYLQSLFLVLLITFGLVMTPACHRHTTRAERQMEKQMKKEERIARKEYRKLVKAHEKKQSKEAIKMMRQAKKRAKKLNKSLVRKK